MKISEKNNVFYLDEGRLELYSPSKYMERINYIDGEVAHVFGLLLYKFYPSATAKKPSKVGVLNNPSMIMIYPTDTELKVTDGIWDGIYDDYNMNEYAVFHIEAGRKLMDKNIIPKVDNVNVFMDALLGASLDNNIPYNYLSKIWIKNMFMNNCDLGIPAPTIDLVISSLCRYKHDKDKSFGSVYGKNPKISPVAYKFANTREVCAMNSVFTGLAFEDMNSMLDSSLNMTQQQKDQKISPLEQIIKF